MFFFLSWTKQIKNVTRTGEPRVACKPIRMGARAPPPFVLRVLDVVGGKEYKQTNIGPFSRGGS